MLRYFGGKWQLKNWIIEHLPEHEYYAEPFAGAASVLLAKEPAKKGELLNDANKRITNLFRVMQSPEDSEELIRRLSWTPYSKMEFDLSREPTDDKIEEARRMIIRSFMGIEVAGTAKQGSGFRMGSVPLSRVDKEGKPTFRNCAKDWDNWKAQLNCIQQRLSKVMVYNQDGVEFIDIADAPNCLLYVDAPYPESTRSKIKYETDFNRHEELVERLLTARSKVVVSTYPDKIFHPLEENGWKRIDKDYRANMSENRRTESLYLSPSAQ